jgi:dihydropteroate synthase
MQLNPQYDDVVADVLRYLEERIALLCGSGLERERIAVDPGIGFGKTAEHNVTLIRHLADFRRLGCPICLGVSRKGFIGRIIRRPVEERVAGSLAVACYAQCQNAVDIIRVHDVKETRAAVDVIAALVTP